MKFSIALILGALLGLLATSSSTSASSGRRRGLNGGNCQADGPSYWCETRGNAKRCNKESYCAENCWSYGGGGRVRQFWRDHVIKHNKVPDSAYADMCTGGNANQRRRFLLTTTTSISIVCDECKVVIGDLSRALKDKQRLESVLSAIRFLCNLLPAYSTVCRNAVNDLGDALEALEPYLDNPEGVCQKIKMCPSGGAANNNNVTFTSVEKLILKTHQLQKQQQSRNNSAANGLCDDCKEACHEIVAQLQDPAQQKNIKETFEALCDFVGPLKNECLRYIDQLVPQLIQFILDRFADPAGLCASLGFC